MARPAFSANHCIHRARNRLPSRMRTLQSGTAGPGKRKAAEAELDRGGEKAADSPRTTRVVPSATLKRALDGTKKLLSQR